MNAPTVAEYLKFANLQLAAEAFIRDPSTGVLSGSGPALEAKLVAGNLHASRFTTAAALDFANHWQALDQKINSNTGFSGTLFQCILDDPKTGAKAGELVISFRSTEFVDDAIRDNLTANQFEIQPTGFAWGQIADMEAWFAKLKTDGLLSGPYTVTGYSLGGHLATVFNLLRSAEQAAPARVITFNGAGIGTISQGTLQDAITSFGSLRNDTDAVAATFRDPVMGDLYRTLRAGLSAGTLTVPQAKVDLANYKFPIGAGNPSDPSSDAAIYLVPQRDRLDDALDQIGRIEGEITRVPALVEGGAGADATRQPKLWTKEYIDGYDLNYRMAVQIAQDRSKSDGLLANGIRAYAGKKMAPDSQRLSNQFEVVGDTTPSAIANSLMHYGNDVRVFIEDQPLVRGGYVASAVLASLDTGDITLLDNGYGFKNFGDTHSLVLLVDSLNVQNTLLQLVQPTLQAGATPLLAEVLKRASNLLKKDGAAFVGTDQGKAEGDVLEYVVNALADLILGPAQLPALKGSLDGNTWAKLDQQLIGAGITGYSGRDALANRLKDITSSTAYAGLAGKLDIRLASSIAPSFARTDFGTFASLYTLSPFIFSAPNASTLESALQATWNPAGKQVFDAWAADRLTAASSSEPKNFNFTDRWYSDRDEMLRRLLVINQHNEPLVWDGRDPDATKISFADDPIVFQDRTKDIEIRRTVATGSAQLVVFGTSTTTERSTRSMVKATTTGSTQATATIRWTAEVGTTGSKEARVTTRISSMAASAPTLSMTAIGTEASRSMESVSSGTWAWDPASKSWRNPTAPSVALKTGRVARYWSGRTAHHCWNSGSVHRRLPV